jgi:hypothetical protein
MKLATHLHLVLLFRVIEEDDIGGICSTHWDMSYIYIILVGKIEWKKIYLEDLGVDGRIILKWILNVV